MPFITPNPGPSTVNFLVTAPLFIRSFPGTRPAPLFISENAAAAAAARGPTTSGLSVWLDASATATLTLSGSNVTTWYDKSSNAYSAAQNNSLGFPTYVAGTYPCVNFDPYQALNIYSRPYISSWTLFVAMNSVNIQARWFISGYSSIPLVFMGMGEPGNKIFSGLVPSAPYDVTGNHIEMTTAQNTNTSAIAAYYRDGTLQTSNIVNAGIPNYSAGLGIGANYSGDYDIGGTYQIYELLLYDSYLTQTDQQKVEGYLAWKWGMQGNLPSGHPYKNAAPA